eukprot:CAMPEP_0195295800 /NCGR_PEP_ID=MMETSP0707-20130614/18082_1 /TAXON_ID=33640 /ORGANISM="Asterionellopsis glacialis, Strain CCMP134" /LENGTH=85 /DNA_ID=CAMNT_0040357111 /DNA_START=220 /DNA_END=473 /DNA_ORIENTATION=+
MLSTTKLQGVVVVMGSSLLCCIHAQQFWKDSYVMNFNYDPQSSKGPSQWSKVEYSVQDDSEDYDSEWSQYDEGHDIHDLRMDERG